MQVNPYTETVSDISEFNYFATDLDYNTAKKDFEAKLKSLEESGEILAVGPKEHLQALQQKLMKRGYKKNK